MREIEIYAQRLNLSVSYQELPYLKPAPLSPCPPGCSPGRGQPRLALDHRPPCRQRSEKKSELVMKVLWKLHIILRIYGK